MKLAACVLFLVTTVIAQGDDHSLPFVDVEYDASSSSVDSYESGISNPFLSPEPNTIYTTTTSEPETDLDEFDATRRRQRNRPRDPTRARDRRIEVTTERDPSVEGRIEHITLTDETPERRRPEPPSERQPVHQPERRPEYQPERRLEYQPERRPEYQPERRPEYQPERRPEYQPERRPYYPAERRPDYQPDRRPDYQPARRLPSQGPQAGTQNLESLYRRAIDFYGNGNYEQFHRLISENVIATENYELLTYMTQKAFDIASTGGSQDQIQIIYDTVLSTLPRIPQTVSQNLREMNFRALGMYERRKSEDLLQRYDRNIAMAVREYGENDPKTIKEKRMKALFLLRNRKYLEAKSMYDAVIPNLPQDDEPPRPNILGSFATDDITENCISTLEKFQQVVEFMDGFKSGDETYMRYVLNDPKFSRREKMIQLIEHTESRRPMTVFERNININSGESKSERIFSKLMSEIEELLQVTKQYNDSFFASGLMNTLSERNIHSVNEPYKRLRPLYEMSLVYGWQDDKKNALATLNELIVEQKRKIGSDHFETKMSKHFKITILELMIEDAKQKNPYFNFLFEVNSASHLSFDDFQRFPLRRRT